METRTNLKISADASEVKKAGQTIKQAFSAQNIKEFSNATRDLDRQFVGLTKKQTELTKQLLNVEKGTKAYKQLTQELKGVREQADLVERSLSQLDRAQKRALATQTKARGGLPSGAPGMGRSFVAGLGQGFGVAQYIPADRGMVARMGGAMLGGGMRRGAGAAAAPFLMPGMGGLATALQAIPLVGGAAAGAAQTAAGAYQSAVAFDRARLQNIYFAGSNIGQRYGSRANPQWVAAQQSQQERTLELERAAERVSIFRRRQKGFRRFAGSAEGRDYIMQKAEQGSEKAKAVVDEWRMGKQIERIQKLSPSSAGFAYSKAAQIKTRENAEQITKRLIKRDLNYAIEDQKRLQKKNDRLLRQEGKIRRRVGGGRETGLGLISLGTEFGLSPTQVVGLQGQFMQQRGGLYEGAVKSQFREALAAQVRHGVSAQQAGAFARMGVAGGGGTGMQGLANVLQGAFAMELRGSQIPEYLQELVGLGQQAEKQGVKINVTEFAKQSMTLRQVGIRGPQIARITGGLQQAAMGLSGRGVQTPMDVLLARAAGFDPSQGPESYAGAMNKLAGGLDQGMLNKLLKMITSGAMSGGGKEMQALLFRRAMSKVGVQVAPGQATKFLTAYSEGKTPQISELLATKEELGGRKGLITAAGEAVTYAAPEAKAAARMDAFRIGVGRANRWVLEFEKTTLGFANALSNFRGSLDTLGKAVNDAVIAFDKFSKGGLKGLAKNSLETAKEYTGWSDL